MYDATPRIFGLRGVPVFVDAELEPDDVTVVACEHFVDDSGDLEARPEHIDDTDASLTSEGESKAGRPSTISAFGFTGIIS